MKLNKYFIILSVLAIAGLGFKHNDSISIMGLKFAAPTIFGKENVYQPEPGEIIYDSASSMFYGRDHIGNWIPLSAGQSIVPTGTIMPFGGTVAPNGYKLCTGGLLNISEAPELFAVIGTAFGGDGVSTFALPDLRGRFLRGVDGTAGIDKDKDSRDFMAAGGNIGNSVGSVQLDAVQRIKGNVGDFDNYATTNIGGANSPFVATSRSSLHGISSGGGDPWWTVSFDSALVTRSSTETRPANANVNYIIKM